MRLAVGFGEANAMKMLYKVQDGFVEEQHYGLALARVVDLPPHVLQVAEKVSQALEAQAAEKRRSSKFQALVKRRKLVKDLREQLQQGLEGPLADKALASWLGRLQNEFIIRMDALDYDAEGSDGEEEESFVSEESGVLGAEDEDEILPAEANDEDESSLQ